MATPRHCPSQGPLATQASSTDEPTYSAAPSPPTAPAESQTAPPASPPTTPSTAPPVVQSQDAPLSSPPSLSMAPLERTLSATHPVIARRRSVISIIPPSLRKPGMELAKVSGKNLERRKPRRFWLDLEVRKEADGVVGKGEMRLCWEKNWAGVGPRREESLPLSQIRQFEHNPSTRMMTISYRKSVTSHALFSSSSTTSGNEFKTLRIIVPDDTSLSIWQQALEKACQDRDSFGHVVPVEGQDEGAKSRGVEVDPDVGEEEGKVIDVKEAQRLCARLGMGMGKEEIDAAFKEAAGADNHLDFKSYQNFVKLLKRRADVSEVFRAATGAQVIMPRADWNRFLVDTQKVSVVYLSSLSPEAIDALYIKYADADTGFVGMDGFLQFLFSAENSPLRDESNQDMHRPLSEYFISTSHNTYLVGNQLKGDSTVEGYIRALRRGCRCVELDIWDGDDGSPVVTHGRTLTSKLTAYDALSTIAKYAFIASQYPVILSFEIHCEVVQQDKLVEILRETLGDKLVQVRLDGGSEPVEVLPSPWELRGKILVKAKNVYITSSAGTQNLAAPVEGGPPPDNLQPARQSSVDSTTSTDYSSASSDSEFKRAFNAVRSAVTDRKRPAMAWSPPSSGPGSSGISFASRSPPLVSNGLQNAPPGRPQKPLMSYTLASILVYTVGVKARGFNKKETYGTTHVLSFGENRLSKMLKEEVVRQDLVDHNRGHLTRAYPKGFRISSTNYLPHHFWAAGVQMVAINWQTYDLGMAFNTGMFARAGRSGYVLKPEILSRRGPDKDKEALTRVANFTLRAEVLSAQELPRSRDNDGFVAMDPFVEVSLHVPGSSTVVRKRTKVLSGNAFNPRFSSDFTFSFQTSSEAGMLDLVFLRFEVLNAKGNLKSAAEEGKGDFVGAYTTPLGCLQEGYRHLPLYDSIGDQHLFSSLFIKSSLIRSSEPVPPPLSPRKSSSSSRVLRPSPGVSPRSSFATPLSTSPPPMTFLSP